MRQFEADFRAFLGVPHAFAISSCTAALELSAVLCDLKPGDEVIVPAHTFAATAIPFARTGATLKWADIDPATRVVSPETIAPLINKKTKAIVVVHLYGLPCDMTRISALAKEHGIKLVEDAAQALGASADGELAGTFGDFSCFSFHGHKNISTLGEGGMLVVKSPQDAAKVPGLRHNGGRPYPDRGESYWIPAMSDVDFDIPGFWPYNFCIGEVQCALGSALLKRVAATSEKRKVRAQKFILALSEFKELTFQSTPKNCTHAWHLLPAQYDGSRFKKTRDDLIRTLAYEFGVQTVVQYYPLYRYPLFKKAGFGEASCPNTDRYFDNMLSFPFQEWMPEEEFELMIELTRKALTRLRS